MSVTTAPTSTTPPATPELDRLITEQTDDALTFAARVLCGSTDFTSGFRYCTILDELERRHPGASLAMATEKPLPHITAPQW